MDLPIQSIPGFAEPFCSLSHLVAAVVLALLSSSLLRRGRDPDRAAALAVFAGACVLLLTTSGVYHLLHAGATRALMRRLDHAAIFGLIAGTFTAAHAILLRGAWRRWMTALIWSFAAIGITLKTIYFDDIPEALGLVFYLGLGWGGLVSGVKIWRTHGWQMLRPLVIGGVAYSLGAVLEYSRHPTVVPGVIGPHEVFHVAVLLGIACHWEYLHIHADYRS